MSLSDLLWPDAAAVCQPRTGAAAGRFLAVHELLLRYLVELLCRAHLFIGTRAGWLYPDETRDGPQLCGLIALPGAKLAFF
jgi:hypothetical protein